ncbi:CLUMA_CG002326, isoform A [Clunio marinus]|uniref:CLUMA_CG002326, isoform A n=1 Tax=Clunio marinus TaxID=568069 RepID=A0A1J1HKJ9_9DIPT|nr:CLUMA_CG002326, isoform A [Clunio marinus]
MGKEKHGVLNFGVNERCEETYCEITLKDPLAKSNSECVLILEITQRKTSKIGRKREQWNERKKRKKKMKKRDLFSEHKFVFPDAFLSSSS